MITGARWEKIFSGVRWSRESYFVYLSIFSNHFFSFFLSLSRLLSSLLPETEVVLDTVLTNREKWQKAQEDGDYVYRPVATTDKEINGNVPLSPS